MDLDDPVSDFFAEVMYVSEVTFHAPVGGEETESWARLLFDEYGAAGKPRPVKKWLKERLIKEFRHAIEPPQWVDRDLPRWPFEDGKPMTFIGQMTIPGTPIANEFLSPTTVLYLFGARKAHELGGWEFFTRTIQQIPM